MDANQAVSPTAAMARVLGVSGAGSYARRHRPPSAHAVADVASPERVGTVHARGTCGAPRVHAGPRADGGRHGRERVARPMRGAGGAPFGALAPGGASPLVGAGRRRTGVTTTRRNEGARPAPDSVDRDSGATGPNQLWVADITSIASAAGPLSLAVVPDARSREVVGWAMANHPRAASALDALEMAVGQRRPKDVIHHSDQGSRCTSPAFGERRKEAGVRPSMGSVGGAYDDAVCESFSATPECEPLDRRRFASRAEAEMACFGSIEGRYNPVRLHPAPGHRSPMAHEAEVRAAETGT